MAIGWRRIKIYVLVSHADAKAGSTPLFRGQIISSTHGDGIIRTEEEIILFHLVHCHLLNHRANRVIPEQEEFISTAQNKEFVRQ